MMLLGTLPQSLFQPLAAPGASVYARLLLDIYRQTQARPDPLSRELILSLIYQQLAEPQALALTDDAQSDEATTPDQIDPLTARASAIVRYLDRCGWLKGETLSDFSVHYILPDYAFRLLRVLGEIAINEPPALAGLVFSTYALLQRILTEPDTAYVGIPQAHRQTQHLLNGLKELQQNIGLHINQILAQSQARDVLEQLFLRYREEIVDRAYHQLRTTDHISRFRPGVLSSVTQLAVPDILKPAAQRFEQEPLFALRKQLGEITPLAMNEATFTQHQRRAQPLTANDRVGLTALHANAGLQDCAGVIGLLLAADRKLEQEAVAPRSAIEWLNKP